MSILFDSNNPSSLPPTVRLLVAVFGIGVTLGSGLGYGFSQIVLGTTSQEQSVQVKPQHINLAGYERLELGMSLAEVEAILDRGTEISRSTTMATFVWMNLDGSKITVIFEGGKLLSKEQSGLQ